jgi:hypothetical protein
MRLMFARALTVAAAVLGGAGAMAFPKLVLRDAIPAQEQQPAIASSLPAPSVQVIRIPRDVLAPPQRHVAARPAEPKPSGVKPVAVRTQPPIRPRPPVTAPADQAPAGTPAPPRTPAPAPRPAPAQNPVPTAAARTPTPVPATAALHGAAPAPPVEHVQPSEPSHDADHADKAKKPKKPKKAKKPKHEEQHEQAAVPPQPEVPAPAGSIDNGTAHESPPVPSTEDGDGREGGDEHGKSKGSSEGNRGRGHQNNGPGNG